MTTTPAQDFFSRQRLLLIRLGGFGDVVFTLPAVQLVRAHFPAAHISFLVYHEFATLLEGFPGVDAVLTLDRARYKKGNPFVIGTELFSLIRQVTRGRFDLVIDFQGFGETGLISWLSGAPERWGSVYRPSRRWAYSRPVTRNWLQHPVDYHLDVVREAGKLVGALEPEFFFPAKLLQQAREMYAIFGLDPGQPTLFIQPFTAMAHKNWPLGNFLEVARHWREQGLQVLFGGGPKDAEALSPVRQAGFAVSAGAPALLSGGLAKLSTLVLGADTGLLHLAVAARKRVVMLMASIEPGSCFPYRHPEWTVLPPPASPVSSITVASVNEACARAFAELGVTPQPACR